jgi:hypothetical protein
MTTMSREGLDKLTKPWARRFMYPRRTFWSTADLFFVRLPVFGSNKSPWRLNGILRRDASPNVGAEPLVCISGVERVNN